MKVSAGTAVRAVEQPLRVARLLPAAQTAAARKVAAAQPAKPAADKVVAKPAAKAPTPAKPATPKVATGSRTTNRRGRGGRKRDLEAAGRQAAGCAAAATQPKPAATPPAPAPVPRRPLHGALTGGAPAVHAGPPAAPAAAKAEIFVEGDHVVYPTHGVGKVERIATEEIAGHKLELIHITFEENRMTLRVPVTKARSAGLRKLATRKLFDEALAVLKGRARIKRTMWSRRAQEYEAKINSAIRWRSPRSCATCTATPGSRTRASPSGRSTRRRWTGWRPNWRRWTRPTS